MNNLPPAFCAVAGYFSELLEDIGANFCDFSRIPAARHPG